MDSCQVGTFPPSAALGDIFAQSLSHKANVVLKPNGADKKSDIVGNRSSGDAKRKFSDLKAGDTKNTKRIREEIEAREEEAAPWLAKNSRLSEEIALAPCEYIASLPSKKVRKMMVEALNCWYQVPKQSMDIIESVIDQLHTSSLIVDDIEDGSELRRGYPSAHMVYGTPQAINSANLLLVKCLVEVQKLSPAAVAIYADELTRLHVGQAMDLHWTFQNECPSESEYIKMIDGKTGGLFRMISRLMRSEATKRRDVEIEHLMNLLCRLFQIRDDYQNLCSATYSAQKGDLSDLDEGKYSFMLIHAIKNAKCVQLKSLLQMRSQKGTLSEEQKALIMTNLKRSKSLEYTLEVLKDLQIEVERSLTDIETAAGGGMNRIMRGLIAKLKVEEPCNKS
ncbi:hypothetical protein TWF694_005463 [Orbilia ellipsospora]|uniref:Geranylgeranyl diphosphate synthase n=1 Tax=Orbilia ellipsospora TaxID=2528407 RepID=A0AAV9WUR7_9PEZI